MATSRSVARRTMAATVSPLQCVAVRSRARRSTTVTLSRLVCRSTWERHGYSFSAQCPRTRRSRVRLIRIENGRTRIATGSSARRGQMRGCAALPRAIARATSGRARRDPLSSRGSAGLPVATPRTTPPCAPVHPSTSVRACQPSVRCGARGVEAATRLAVRLARVPAHPAREPAPVRDPCRPVADRDLAARAPDSPAASVEPLEREHHASAASCDVEELAGRLPGAPHLDLGVAASRRPRRTCGSAPGSRASWPGRSCRAGRRGSPAARSTEAKPNSCR